MAETKNENLRFSIYTALLVLICLTVYICVHFNAAIFSTRHTETYSIIKADTFDTINDNTTPLGIYNELAFTLPAAMSFMTLMRTNSLLKLCRNNFVFG